MATREENLKKINEELEKLDDEQLEEIAGGKHIMYPPRTLKLVNDPVANKNATLIGV